MEKTVCELFAGVGGFRCGLNSIKSIEDTKRPEKWETVWFSQWEPVDKKVQWAHDCYVNRFGTCMDLEGNDTTNMDIHSVDKKTVPDHNLLVGGFPCQDYSVASSLATSKGLEGKKGILWWDIRDMLEEKGAPFVLLENVDRLIKSPASQRGRDFGIILACFRDLGYTVEWRVINAAEYGYQQRRRRTFIFAYRDDTAYAKRIMETVGHNGLASDGLMGHELMDDGLMSDGLMGHELMDDGLIGHGLADDQLVSDRQVDDEPPKRSMGKLLLTEGFFAKSFPVDSCDVEKLHMKKLPESIGELSSSFSFTFENSGVMKDGVVYTLKTSPSYDGGQITLGDIMEDGDVDKSFFIPEERLYYTDRDNDHSDETQEFLSDEAHKTWQYVKGAKKLPRKAKNGHEYIFSEGPVPMIDEYDKPARTMLTSEGAFNRTTHIVRDKKTGEIRLLTPIEVERIQGFPSDWTKECLVDGEIVEMPVHKRRFMMGNALVVNLVSQMEKQLSEIFEAEG